MEMDKLHVQHLMRFAPPKDLLNRGNTRISQGFKNDGTFVGLETALYKINKLLPQKWTFGFFFSGVKDGLIDCDTISAFQKFIFDHQEALDAEFGVIEEGDKPDYSPKQVTLPVLLDDSTSGSKTDEYSSSDGEGRAKKKAQAKDKAKENDKGQEETAKSTKAKGPPRKKVSSKVTTMYKLVTDVFHCKDTGEGDELREKYAIGQPMLLTTLKNFFEKGLVKSVTFHEDQLKEYLDTELATESIETVQDATLKKLVPAAEEKIKEKKSMDKEASKKRKAEKAATAAFIDRVNGNPPKTPRRSNGRGNKGGK